jgi:hypothetical protein
MAEIALKDIEKLVSIESHIHYSEAPPPGVPHPFVSMGGSCPVLLSAPHGTRTRRNAEGAEWHEEDEYTAGMVLLLSELCGAWGIADVWRSDDADPNWHYESTCPYKRQMRKLVEENGIRWIVDLHGMSGGELKRGELVDLGTRLEKQSLPADQELRLTRLLEARLGAGAVHRNRFSARATNRTITAFGQDSLGVYSVQVEMKPAVRVPFRRPDSSAFREYGPFSAGVERVVGMMQALADFVDYLSGIEE